MKTVVLGLSVALISGMAATLNGGEEGPPVLWTSREAAAPGSLEEQLRSQGMSWSRSDGQIVVGTLVQDVLEGRLGQPVGRGAIGVVVAVGPGAGQMTATVDFGRSYTVGIQFSELCPVKLVNADRAAGKDAALPSVEEQRRRESHSWVRTDPDVLAIGDWSEPVANKYDFKVRGRLLMCEYPHHRGPRSGNDVALYVELQEYSDFLGAVGEIYWDPRGLRCELTDSSGKPVPNSPGDYGGGVAPACWIKLPSHSSMRLRVSPYAGGRLSDGGFGIWAALPQVWTLKPGDIEPYSLSGELKVASGTDHKPADFRYVWNGTLKLPKLELSLQKLQPKNDGRHAEDTSKSSLRASIGVSAPVFTTEQVEHGLQVGFVLVNDGNKHVDPRVNTWQLNINGKDHPDSQFMFNNGPRDGRWESLPPGDRLQFNFGLGDWCKTPGVYKVVWRGEGFESAPAVFRVIAETKEK